MRPSSPAALSFFDVFRARPVLDKESNTTPIGSQSVRRRRLVQPDLERQLGLVALLSDGRIHNTTDVPFDRLVTRLEGKVRDENGENDLFNAGSA